MTFQSLGHNYLILFVNSLCLKFTVSYGFQGEKKEAENLLIPIKEEAGGKPIITFNTVMKIAFIKQG